MGHSLDFSDCLINQGTKILTMTQTLFFRVLPEMISTVALEKVTLSIMEASVNLVISKLKLKTSGNKKILRRDMKMEKTDFSFNRYSQEQDRSQVEPKLQ